MSFGDPVMTALVYSIANPFIEIATNSVTGWLNKKSLKNAKI